MLNTVTQIFNGSTSESNSNPMSNLLIILSDGRGIFYEGMEQVNKTVQKALQERIFIVFIILDMPGKSSVFDIKMPIFTENNTVMFDFVIFI